MSWFNVKMGKADVDFLQYSHMIKEMPYLDKEKYTYDKFRKRKRTPLPKQQRDKIYQRSWRLCERCYNSDLDDIHHIDGNPSNHILANLIGLCKTCHKNFKKFIVPYGISEGSHGNTNNNQGCTTSKG